MKVKFTDEEMQKLIDLWNKEPVLFQCLLKDCFKKDAIHRDLEMLDKAGKKKEILFIHFLFKTSFNNRPMSQIRKLYTIFHLLYTMSCACNSTAKSRCKSVVYDSCRRKTHVLIGLTRSCNKVCIYFYKNWLYKC